MAKTTIIKELHHESIKRRLFENKIIKDAYIGELIYLGEELNGKKNILFNPSAAFYRKETLKFIIKEIEKAEKEYLHD